MPESIQALLREAPKNGAPTAGPTTAVFYSISNCQEGLRGISFGNFLIKQVAADLHAELPNLKVFATLSPVPGLRKWVRQQVPGSEEGKRETLEGLAAWAALQGA